jgi:predicted metalloprotease with PDZ domain
MRRDELEALATAMGGLAILGCLPSTPAAEAGLRYGDVLLEVNGVPTPDWVAYVRASRTRSVMAIRVFRDGSEVRLALSLPERPEPLESAALLDKVLRSGVLPKMAELDAHASTKGRDDKPLPS